MIILEIIVDKLPKGCFECPLLVIGVDILCITNRKVIKDDKSRPKWCPLHEIPGQLSNP